MSCTAWGLQMHYAYTCISYAAGRALVGIGAGAASLYVPRYVSEVSPVAVRGALATGNQVPLVFLLSQSLRC